MYPNTTVNQAVTYTYSLFLLVQCIQGYVYLLPISHEITNGFSVTVIQCEMAFLCQNLTVQYLCVLKLVCHS